MLRCWFSQNHQQYLRWERRIGIRVLDPLITFVSRRGILNSALSAGARGTFWGPLIGVIIVNDVSDETWEGGGSAWESPVIYPYCLNKSSCSAYRPLCVFSWKHWVVSSSQSHHCICRWAKNAKLDFAECRCVLVNWAFAREPLHRLDAGDAEQTARALTGT